MPTARLLPVFFLACTFLSVEAQKLNISTIASAGDSISSADLQAASGLKPGPLGQADVQAGAQKLNESGMFSHIDFTVHGAVLQFQLTPATGRVPVQFENFPWWSDRTLVEKIHAAAPLFRGSVIPNTGLDQQVASALTALLVAQHIDATVESNPVIPKGAQAPTAVRYRIATPPVTVGPVLLKGESAGTSAELAAVAKAATGRAV